MGARSYVFDLDSGRATFLPPRGQPVDPGEVRTAVERSGFEMLDLELEVRGSLHRARDPTGVERLALEVAGSGQVFLLVPGDSAQEQELHGRLAEWLDAPGRLIIARGRAHAHVAAPPTLAVGTFRVLPDDRGLR